jgi:mxaJ protein
MTDLMQHPRTRVVLAALLAALVVAPPVVAQEEGGAGSAPASFPNTQAWKDMKAFRVCGDPDNMPFSNREEQGLDNKIATVIAKALGDSVVYTWWPHRRGFVRNTLSASACDVIMGVPANFDLASETNPYYRSTYYIVTRTDRHLDITSMSDPRLKTLKVGVNLIGYDYTNTPPAEALGEHGITKDVQGFSTFYGKENQPQDIVDAVASGKIDVAFVWGPLAGYFAKRSKVPLTLTPLPDSDAAAGVPFTYNVTIGVRHSDHELRDTLNTILAAKRDEIRKILASYDVPMLPLQH